MKNGWRILAITSVLSAFIFSNYTFAEECYILPVEENFEKADLVFTGRVIHISNNTDLGSSTNFNFFTSNTFEIMDILKGSAKNIVKVESRANFGDSCGFNFSKNEEYLVYANVKNSEFYTDFNSGTKELSNSFDEFLKLQFLKLLNVPDSIMPQLPFYAKDEITDVEAAPPSPDSWEKHREKVDSIISMQEKPSPKEQRKIGILYHTVMCNNDFVLLLKWTSNKSACVSPQTAEKLIERNWGVYAKDVSVVNFGDDPRELPFKGGPTSISFEYDVSKYDEVKLFKKIREKFSEHFKELGWPGDYVWAYMFLDKKSEGHFTLEITGGIREDLMRDPLEKIEGISNIENYAETFA